MTKILTIRKGNSDNSTILTIPKPTAEMFGIVPGTKVEIKPYMTNAFIIEVLKN